ncbi:MAG TPA: hypothetical protein PLI77_04305 [Bacteroidales bacterium]|jgi:hypothetical protein|nr:hypothetical protein [Bacteroidales bacterium]HPE40295.1 hypothetical protein [Bacteroidales bacterium]
MTIEEIKEEVHQYQKALEQPIPLEINHCLERISFLSGVHCRTGYLLANAKKHLRTVKESQLYSHLLNRSDRYLSSQIQNAMLDGLAIEETYYVELLEKMNYACSQQIEVCRTIISKEKEEMRFAGSNHS